MSYKQPNNTSLLAPTPSPIILESDLDSLLLQMRAKFGDVTPIRASELKQKFQEQVSQNIAHLHAQLDTKF